MKDDGRRRARRAAMLIGKERRMVRSRPRGSAKVVKRKESASGALGSMSSRRKTCEMPKTLLKSLAPS